MVVVPFSDPEALQRNVRQKSKSPNAERLPISATIITYNEAERIGACIASLAPLVDQIIVLDSGSQDRTREIAAGMGAVVDVAEWVGYGPQKRRAEELCDHDWILNIDADERLSPALAAEIRLSFTTGAPPADAYRLRIVDQLPHEDTPSSWAFAYRRIRLYNLRKGRFVDSLVHDDVMMEADTDVRDFKGPVAHVSIQNLSSHVAKLNRYTDLQIEDMRIRGRQLPKWRLLTEFPFAFFKSYFLRRRIIYGWWGVIHSINYAHMRFLRVAKAYEDRTAQNTE